MAVLVGRKRVARVLVEARPWPTRTERADLRAAERVTADVLAALPLDAPERPDAVRAARLARETRDAALAHGGRPARVAVDVLPVVEYRPRPATTAADVLAAGYRPEILAENTSTNRRRGDVYHYRAMSWAAVLPTSSETARVQVAKAARTWADDVLGRPVGTRPATGAAVLPVLPAVARGELLPSCQTCQDRGHGHHGQTSYTRTAATVGPRAARVRAGGAAARAADQDGRTARTMDAAADRLADRSANFLPAYVPGPSAVRPPVGLIPRSDAPDAPGPYGAAAYVVGQTGTVRAAWEARADDYASALDVWIAERAQERGGI